MSRWHNYYVDCCAHFITCTVQDWQQLLDEDAIRVLYDEWERARQAVGVKVLAYVVMPNHFHAMVWSERGEDVARFIRRVLSRTAQRIGGPGGLWKERPRVLPCYTRPAIKIKVDYIHANPVRKGLVTAPEEWPHSSFRQLEMGLTPLHLVCDDWPIIPLR